ncbi:hypothetical protein C8R43DRAFT_1229952 [Mycena crocata]|nr:hypothetical protein C8R43DRAFT_1229952 [Mycena crocata]
MFMQQFPSTPQRSYPPSSSPLTSGSSSSSSGQTRRRSQYKARVSSSARRDTGDDSQSAFVRTQLKLQCIERASKARARAVLKKRTMSSSSGVASDAESDEEEDPLFDELYTRIMQETLRKLNEYTHSFDCEVRSPEMEENWESELLAALTEPDEATAAAQKLEDDAALQAYLEEQAAFADFADIPADDLFNWNYDDLANPTRCDGNEMDMS